MRGLPLQRSFARPSDAAERALRGVVSRYRSNARRKRADVFRSHFSLSPGARILDLGSEDGSHIHAVLPSGMDVYIADIDEECVLQGAARFGFTPVVISDSGALPFEDGFFDVVFCSSVIEHVTPFGKDECWEVRRGKAFRTAARRRQDEFAREIARVGKAFFVQTPNRWFPVESHSWAPGLAFLPRRAQVPVLAWLNRWWIKDTGLASPHGDGHETTVPRCLDRRRKIPRADEEHHRDYHATGGRGAGPFAGAADALP